MVNLRERLSFANVISVIALFVALGGTALAASQLGKNTVGPKQLKKNAVTTAKIKKEAVTAAKVKKGTLTGRQINVSMLGVVPEATHAAAAETASTLQGSGPNAFVHGDGSVIVNRLEMDADPGNRGTPLLNIPGGGQILTGCDASGVVWGYRNNGDVPVDVIFSSNNGKPSHLTYGKNSFSFFGSSTDITVHVQLATQGAKPIHADIQLAFLRDLSGHCSALGQATVAQ
jgi:hypothetical protein